MCVCVHVLSQGCPQFAPSPPSALRVAAAAPSPHLRQDSTTPSFPRGVNHTPSSSTYYPISSTGYSTPPSTASYLTPGMLSTPVEQQGEGEGEVWEEEGEGGGVEEGEGGRQLSRARHSFTGIYHTVTPL